jgi:iron complex outermembrane receptor protein
MSDSVRTVTQPLKPEEVSTWELGYKGIIAKNLYVDISGYNGLSKNFFSPSVPVAGRALLIGSAKATPLVPGQVINDTLKNAQFLTVFNFGDVRVYGVDAGLTYNFNKFISFAVRYSWLGSDISEGHADNDANEDDTVSTDERSLNSPVNRVVVLLNFQNLSKQKIFINLSARYTSQYDFYSGNQISTAAGEGKRGFVQGPFKEGRTIWYPKNYDWGPLGGFTIIDLSAGYKLNDMVNLNMNITNLFNVKQREFVGSPYIGRLIMFELKVQVPNGSK